MIELLLKQSLNDFVFYEDIESVLALEKYADNPGDAELESRIFERLDFYLLKNVPFFELLTEYRGKEDDSESVTRKGVKASGKTVVDLEDYLKKQKANIPDIKPIDKDKKKDKKKVKKKARDDIRKLSKSNIIKRKMGTNKFTKTIKDAIAKKIKSSKTGKYIKRKLEKVVKSAIKSHKDAKAQYKKSSKAYEKLATSDNMKAKRSKLREAAKDRRALGKGRLRRRYGGMVLRKLK